MVAVSGEAKVVYLATAGFLFLRAHAGRPAAAAAAAAAAAVPAAAATAARAVDAAARWRRLRRRGGRVGRRNAPGRAATFSTGDGGCGVR